MIPPSFQYHAPGSVDDAVALLKELGDGVMIVDEMQEEEIPTTEENVANLTQSILLKISGVGGTFATICREFAMRYGFSANLHLGWGVTRGRVIKMSEPRADYLGANINKCSYLCGIARPWGIVMDREDFTELSPSAPFQFIPQERKLAGMAKTIPVWVTLEIANEFIPREQLRQTPEVHVAGVCIRQENGTNRSDQALWVEGNWRKRCHHETSFIVQRVQNPPGQG